MKRNFLYTCLIALASLGFVACDSEENEKETKVPDGAKPTQEFTFGDCEDEAHAEDAMKLEVKSWDGYTTQDFTSIEFFGDGHYLITTPLAHYAPERTAVYGAPPSSRSTAQSTSPPAPPTTTAPWTSTTANISMAHTHA